MADSSSPAHGPHRRRGPIAELTKLFDAAKTAESGDPEAARASVERLTEFADQHRAEFADGEDEVASAMEFAARGLLRLGNAEAATRAAEVGLAASPSSASLLGLRAQSLLARDSALDDALTNVERALQRQPHDKSFWALKGEILARQDNREAAAEALLSAQRLDPASTQYLDRAIELSPQHRAALLLRVELARSQGGDALALDAADRLLADRPGQPDLLVARADVLSALGRYPEVVESLERARTAGADPNEVGLRTGRTFLALNRTEDAMRSFRECLERTPPLSEAHLAEVADLASTDDRDLELAIQARSRLAEREPRNQANLSSLRTLAARTGKTEIGIRAARAVLDISPGNLEAMRGLAELLHQAGQVDESLDAYRALLDAHPQATEDVRRALELARGSGRPEQVEAFARAVLAERPGEIAAQEELARLLEGRGDLAGALAAVDTLLDQHPGTVALLLDKKRLLESMGRPEAVAPVLDEVFRRDPTRADIALERGNLYLSDAFDQPEGSEAREVAARSALVSYERASLNTERSAASLLGLARASRLLRDPERAVRAYRQFLEQRPGESRPDVRKELGHALRELHRLAEADEAYQLAIQQGSDDADLLWGEVEVLALLDQDAKALRYLDALLEREPQNPLFLRRKGQLLLKSGRRAEGLAVLKLAVEGGRGDPHVLFEVAEALRAQGIYADALAYFRQALDLDPKNRGGRLAMAETLVLAGEASAAIGQVDTLLREDPNDLVAWQTRADAYRSLGRPAEVLYSLKAILLLDPHNGAALAEKLRLHLAADEKAEGATTLSQLLAVGGPESRDAARWLQYGDLSSELGRAEEANRAYERAAQIDPGQRNEIALRRARLRLRAGRPDLALEVMDAAPGSERTVGMLLLRAEILQALERPGEALSVYQEVQKREPRSPVALAGIARSNLDQGKHAEAKEFLVAAIPQGPPSPELFLLLAEAHAGLGSLPESARTIETAIQAMPKEPQLWVRLGELRIAQESWTDASQAFAHAIALKPDDTTLLRRAGFVAEKLGHPNEALALYEHATDVAPADKDAWTSRGRALLLTGRPDDARQSFDRALSLDSDYEPAKEGRKASVQRTRDLQVAKYGREALLLETRLNRPVTKNDLFVSLHVPFELLEPVLSSLSRDPRIDLGKLSEEEFKELESASYHLIVGALEKRPDGIERRGLTLSDVAALSPPNASLEQVQRLFGFVRSVLEADLRAENLRLTPELEELARRGLVLPDGQRTLFQLVRTLRVGLYKARLIKAVEAAGAAVHAPLPAVDLGAYSPEFRPGAHAAPRIATDSPVAEESPGSPSIRVPAPAAEPVIASGEMPRCVGCGGVAAVTHSCGGALCRQCVAQFQTCPKCQLAVDAPGALQPIAGHGSHGRSATKQPTELATSGRPATLDPASAPKAGPHSSKSSPSRHHPHPAAPPGPSSAESHGHSAGAAVHHAPTAHPAADHRHGHDAAAHGSPAAGAVPPDSPDPEKSPPAAAEPEGTPSPPRPAHPKEKADDEPRL